jgi:hypothetical protein
MSKTEVLDFLSLKYVTASFMATYFSGVVHPLDLIKTRFQSINKITKAMMENPALKILFQNTMG